MLGELGAKTALLGLLKGYAGPRDIMEQDMREQDVYDPDAAVRLMWTPDTAPIILFLSPSLNNILILSSMKETVHFPHTFRTVRVQMFPVLNGGDPVL